jgi:hypothetical protein
MSKDPMDINEEFLDLFMDDMKSKNPKPKSKSKPKTKPEPKPENNFKDDIKVFIEQSEIVDIKKVLNIIDKLKKKLKK